MLMKEIQTSDFWRRAILRDAISQDNANRNLLVDEALFTFKDESRFRDLARLAKPRPTSECTARCAGGIVPGRAEWQSDYCRFRHRYRDVLWFVSFHLYRSIDFHDVETSSCENNVIRLAMLGIGLQIQDTLRGQRPPRTPTRKRLNCAYPDPYAPMSMSHSPSGSW